MKRRITVVLLLLAAGVATWLAVRRGPEPVTQAVSESPAAPDEQPVAAAVPTTADPIEATPDAPIPELPGAVLPRPRTVSLAAVDELPAAVAEPEAGSTLAPVTALENMRTVIRQYSLRFGENPVGNNPEITAILNGRNPRQVVFLQPDDGARVNDRGELVDNWGTPYFFHQLSRTEMEIQSAGPDHRMWTADDLVIK